MSLSAELRTTTARLTLPADPTCATWREYLGDLLDRSREGDTDSFMQFYDHTCAVAYRLFRSRLASPAAAEEATQALYLDTWRRLDTYRASGLSPLAWLLADVNAAPVLTAC